MSKDKQVEVKAVEEVVEKVNGKQIQFEGMEHEKIVVSNEMIFKLDEILKSYNKSVEQFEGAIEDYKEQEWFLMVSKKDSPKEEERYNSIREDKLKGVRHAIEGGEKALKEQIELRDKIQNFVDILNTHIDFDVRINDKGEKEYYAKYDENFFTPLTELAQLIGWIDLEEKKK